jgi:hypothetical protein
MLAMDGPTCGMAYARAAIRMTSAPDIRNLQGVSIERARANKRRMHVEKPHHAVFYGAYPGQIRLRLSDNRSKGMEFARRIAYHPVFFCCLLGGRSRGEGMVARLRFILSTILASALVSAGASHAPAGTVSLEWRPPIQHVHEGDPVSIGLYAVSDDGDPQSIAGLDAVIIWDPAIMTLTGRVNNGPYAWLLSRFPDDSELDGLNATWLDGNAFYQAVSRLSPNPPASITADGLLVTTFTFSADVPGTTAVSFIPEFGDFSFTRVLDAETPGLMRTGSLRGAAIVVAGCGLSMDLDADCDVDLNDFEGFDLCMGGPTTQATFGCQAYDYENSGSVDLRDFAEFARYTTGDRSE